MDYSSFRTYQREGLVNKGQRLRLVTTSALRYNSMTDCKRILLPASENLSGIHRLVGFVSPIWYTEYPVNQNPRGDLRQ